MALNMDTMVLTGIFFLAIISQTEAAQEIWRQPCGLESQRSWIVNLLLTHGGNETANPSTIQQIEEELERIDTLQYLYENRTISHEVEIANLTHLDPRYIISCHDNYQMEYCLSELHGLLVRCYLYVDSSLGAEVRYRRHSEEITRELEGLRAGLQRVLCALERINLVTPWKQPCSCSPTRVLKAVHFAVPRNRAERLARDVVLFRRVKLVLTEVRDTFTVMFDGGMDRGSGPEN